MMIHKNNNIVRPIMDGYYRLNNRDYSSIIGAMSTVLNIPMPYRPKRYKCSFYAKEEDEYCVKEYYEFNNVVETAFHYPSQFKCTGLNDEEKIFIDAILEYKITEKLKS